MPPASTTSGTTRRSSLRTRAGSSWSTPDGRLARYFFGIEYASRDVKFALIESSAGRIGNAIDQLLLYCYHYDPATGQYGFVAMNPGQTRRCVDAIAALVGFVIVSVRRDARACALIAMSLFGIPIFPEQASSFAKDVDALYFFIVAVSAFFALLIAVLVIVFGIKFHRRHEGEVGARIEGNLPHGAPLEHHSDRHLHGDVRLGRLGLLPPAPSARRVDAHLRRRQAVDVEVPAPRRTARDQRAARADRARHQGHADVRGRDSQPLLPDVPDQDRRDSRTLHRALVRTDRSRAPITSSAPSTAARTTPA